MSTYLFAYRAAKTQSPAGADAMAAWNNWFRDLGSHLVETGNPVFERSTLGDCDTDTVLGGYSLIEAENLDAAVELAKGCPNLQNGGGVEVGELTMLNPSSIATTVEDHTRATQIA